MLLSGLERSPPSAARMGVGGTRACLDTHMRGATFLHSPTWWGARAHHLPGRCSHVNTGGGGCLCVHAPVLETRWCEAKVVRV